MDASALSDALSEFSLTSTDLVALLGPPQLDLQVREVVPDPPLPPVGELQ